MHIYYIFSHSCTKHICTHLHSHTRCISLHNQPHLHVLTYTRTKSSYIGQQSLGEINEEIIFAYTELIGNGSSPKSGYIVFSSRQSIVLCKIKWFKTHKNITMLSSPNDTIIQHNKLSTTITMHCKCSEMKETRADLMSTVLSTSKGEQHQRVSGELSKSCPRVSHSWKCMQNVRCR